MPNHDFPAVPTKADVLFEASWEVCNKVGGIYTVLISKAATAASHYKNYFLIGPYFHEKVLGEFEETPPPEEWKQAFSEMQKLGVHCRCGSWLIKGEPKAILLDFQGYFQKTNEIKGALWNDFKIDSLNSRFEVDEPITWSHAVGVLIEKLSKVYEGKKIVAQFHEWLSAAGLLYLKQSGARVSTVFTTHATVLGRAIASTQDLYAVLDKIDSEPEAYNRGVHTKHQIERAAAQNADAFTTVSEITGREAEHLLKKKPDELLPNGLDMEQFPSFEDVSIKHSDMKFRIKEFILYYFFPYQHFDLDETLIYFTFSRYEFRNKGIDAFIRALSKLNHKMKEEDAQRTVVAFFFIPAAIKGIKAELVENRDFYEDVKESVDNSIKGIRNEMLVSLLSQQDLLKGGVFSKEFLTETKKKMMRFTKEWKTPLLCTHDLDSEWNDPILNAFRQFGLTNQRDDKVKVVFYPTYLTGADGLLDLDYYDAIVGGHLGVFPSIYEPWGYTPLETSAMGVASLTTDLTGFGRYVSKQRPKEICDMDHCDPIKEQGIFVARRMGKTDEESVDELFNIMYFYTQLNKEGRINNKIEARRMAGLADWKNLFNNYITAHNIAVAKKFGA